MRNGSERVRVVNRVGRGGLFVLLLGAVLLMTLTSCGYRLASANRSPEFSGKLAIQPLLNETTAYEVEQILTRALVAEFVKRSRFSVVNDPVESDKVLSGKISEVTVNPVTYGKTAFASTFLVTIYVSLELRDRHTGEVVFRKPDYIFREEYVINVDPEHFFSEANPAIDRLSEDFASSVVTTITEGF